MDRVPHWREKWSFSQIQGPGTLPCTVTVYPSLGRFPRVFWFQNLFWAIPSPIYDIPESPRCYITCPKQEKQQHTTSYSTHNTNHSIHNQHYITHSKPNQTRARLCKNPQSQLLNTTFHTLIHLQHNPTWKPSFLLHLGFQFQLQHDQHTTSHNNTSHTLYLLENPRSQGAYFPRSLPLSFPLLLFFFLSPQTCENQETKEKLRAREMEKRKRAKMRRFPHSYPISAPRKGRRERFLSVWVCVFLRKRKEKRVRERKNRERYWGEREGRCKER